MAGTDRYAVPLVARRVVARTVRHVVRDPIILLGLAGLVAFLVIGTPGTQAADRPAPAVPAEDAADQYMRGLLTRDVGEVFASLSPDMRRSLEQRTGLAGPAAVTALFQEQERRGERIVGYKHIASYQTVQGENLKLYVVQARRGSEKREIPYLLTLAPDGTIAKIE
jgi:hypothetical protein